MCVRACVRVYTSMCAWKRAWERESIYINLPMVLLLGTQLIRRNDELALLYEKIKIQQSTLNKGEVQYRERLEDIRMLKLKINDLKRKLHMLKQQTSNIDVLRNEVYHLQRELLSERTKVDLLECLPATKFTIHNIY